METAINVCTKPVLLIFMMCLSCSVLLLSLPCADAHGFLAQPASRNVYAHLQGQFYDPMSGNGVGTNGNIRGPGWCTRICAAVHFDLVAQLP